MGLFSRKSTPLDERPFWQRPPFPSDDPDVLYQHGISCVSAGDGPGMLSVGFALWDLVGLNQHQAWDFISDGFAKWTDTGASVSERIALLDDMLQRLDRLPLLPVDIDLHSLPPGVIEPTADYYTARCWAISESLTAHESCGARTPALDAAMLARLELIHPGFMPPRTLSHYGTLKTSAGRNP